MVLTAKDPDELAIQLGAVDSLMDRQTALYDDLKATEAMLRTQEKKVSAAKAEVAKQRKAAAANLVRRQALERAAAANRAAVAELVTQRSRIAAQARAIRARDARKLKQAKKEEAHIKQLILERARHKKGGYSGADNGFLLHPVANSYITSPFGWRRHPIYGYWGLHNGDDFHAPCGTPELASASGTVFSEYYSSVWGNRLFIDVGRVNGKTMTLVYNHISKYRVHSGARVERGETVAYAGTTGWSTACHLHFTVLLDGNPVNPTQFF
jgi:murein DD-endopeptidase MepM/ murein hydrolase activator NlpD